jgi:transposase InsO family protein
VRQATRLATQSQRRLEDVLAERVVGAGLTPHSDRGVLDASHEYTELLKAHGIRISMSRGGNPYDNAQAESFIKTLKDAEVGGRHKDTLPIPSLIREKGAGC